MITYWDYIDIECGNTIIFGEPIMEILWDNIQYIFIKNPDIDMGQCGHMDFKYGFIIFRDIINKPDEGIFMPTKSMMDILKYAKRLINKHSPYVLLQNDSKLIKQVLLKNMKIINKTSKGVMYK